KKPEQIEASRECKRHGQQNVRGLQEGAIRQIKEDVDDPDGNRDDNLEPFLSTNFALKLPAPVVVITGRHLHSRTDGSVCISDDAAGVPAPRIQQNGNFQQAILAVDLSWPGYLTYVCNLSQWYLCSIRSRHEHVCKIFWIAPELRCIADTHRESPPPFDSGG